MMAVVFSCLLAVAVWGDLSQVAENSQIELRGFVYAKEDGQHVLAAQPNLRSCCLDSNKNKEIVYLTGPLPNWDSTRAVTLQGQLSSQNGVKTLVDAKILKKTSSYAYIWGLLLFIASGILWITYRKIKTQSSSGE